MAVWNMAFVVDAGHGGRDPGAAAALRHGFRECDVNLAVASHLVEALAPHFLYAMPTRLRDEYVPLEERVALANRHPEAWTVSIHVNSLAAPRASVRGCEAHVYREDGDAAKLAPYLIEACRRVGMPPSKRGVVVRGKFIGGLVVSEHLYLLKHTLRPAVILELGYATSAEDRKLLTSSAWRRQVAAALAEACHRFACDRALMRVEPVVVPRV